ncbi:YraN family protein [Candidatus Epulonipiscium fishelsonii]|uniref:YraN family protein n=1 Tax=Candidatus Epulonipiscium fishelsonii TaxID=77094 RepID=A0ACC8X8V9_9FIRM|nr:YraN family protein [Epulopiscium sp. SCG-D08WGA-EpuloA1]
MQEQTNSVEIGKHYEKLAEKFLVIHGYIILRKNYKKREGEIDIICQRDKDIVFVEVKYRTSIKNGFPREYVTYKKQKKIIIASKYYIMEENHYDVNYRYDVIEIYKNNINHIENAFLGG